MSPWKCPRGLEETDLLGILEDIASRLKDPKSSVYNIHVPPVNSGIDVAPEIDSDTLKPVTVGGEPQCLAVGSNAVKSVIQNYQPLVDCTVMFMNQREPIS